MPLGKNQIMKKPKKNKNEKYLGNDIFFEIYDFCMVW
jgi:hypothetical protein